VDLPQAFDFQAAVAVIAHIGQIANDAGLQLIVLALAIQVEDACPTARGFGGEMTERHRFPDAAASRHHSHHSHLSSRQPTVRQLVDAGQARQEPLLRAVELLPDVLGVAEAEASQGPRI
jgi:hypothetical protein